MPRSVRRRALFAGESVPLPLCSATTPGGGATSIGSGVPARRGTGTADDRSTAAPDSNLTETDAQEDGSGDDRASPDAARSRAHREEPVSIAPGSERVGRDPRQP